VPPVLAGSGSWSDLAHLTFISTTVLSALLVLVTTLLWIVARRQTKVSDQMAGIELARAERETTARLIIRRPEDYAVIGDGSYLEFGVFVSAEVPTTAVGVRVTALIGDRPVAEAQPVTIRGGTEERIELRVRGADELALEHSDGKKGDLVVQLWLRAQPTNGPAVEWHWEDGLSSQTAHRQI
jgi:hypothetical protein